MNLKLIFISELIGTSTLVLMGCGVIANAILLKTKGNQNSSFLMINLGWGFAVFIAIIIAMRSGAHLNPAVTIGIACSGAKEYVSGISVNLLSTLTYIVAQLIGSFIGALMCYIVYKKHFDIDNNPSNQLSVFATNPAIYSYKWNLITEIIATFILVFTILLLPNTLSNLAPLGISLLVVGIGLSLGGPTGYAINPARDLAPRFLHYILPIKKDKNSSNWQYAWIPVCGPLIGGILAGIATTFCI